MSQRSDNTLRDGLFAAGLLTAVFAVPAWAAGQGNSAQHASGGTPAPATKSQTEMLRHKPQTGKDRQPQGKGAQAAGMPATKGQTSVLKENKNMSHDNSMKNENRMGKQPRQKQSNKSGSSSSY